MDHERRIATLEGIAQEIRDSLHNIDNRFNSLEARLDNRFNEVNARITSILVVTIILWATAILSIVGAALGFFLGTP